MNASHPPDTGSPRRARLPDALALLAWLALVALAVSLRLPLADLGFTSDEIVNVTEDGLLGMLRHAETAVNPPGLRWLINLPFDPWDAARFGRRFALACSVAALGLVYVVARRAAGGSRVAGLLATALLALHPSIVRDAGLVRAYAWFDATVLLHLLAMGAVLDAPQGAARRRWLGLSVATAAVLPWIHYFAVPLLLGLGGAALATPGRRRLVLAYAPAALLALPLAPHVLGDSSQRVRTPDAESVGALLTRLASLGLQPRGPVGGLLGGGAEAVAGHAVDPGALLAGLTVALVLVGVGLARALPATARLALGGLVGVGLGAVAFSRVQYVRPATLSIVVTLAAVALPAVAATVPRGRAVALLLLASVYGPDLPGRLRLATGVWEADAAPRWLAVHHGDVIARAGARPILVQPRPALWSVWFELTHQVPWKAPRGARCDGLDPCLALGGATWAGVDDGGDGADLDAVVLTMDPWRPPGALSACTPIEDHAVWGLFDCRGGAPR